MTAFKNFYDEIMILRIASKNYVGREGVGM